MKPHHCLLLLLFSCCTITAAAQTANDYRSAAKRGDAAAQNNLGDCYYNGQGVSQDYTQAVYWYRKSAKRGNAFAQSNLGWCYQYGKGVSQNNTRAIYWYRKSAEQGNAFAQLALSSLNNNRQYVKEQNKTSKPANINFIPNSIAFVDATGNNAIDANEACAIRFQIKNSGMGDGFGCTAKVSATGNSAGIAVRNQTLKTIAVGETYTVEIPITANMSTTNGQVQFALQVDEPNGFGTDPQYITVNTKAFEAPKLQIVDYTITGTNGSTLVKKQPFDLQLMLQNTQYGQAEDVKVQLLLPDGVFLLGGDEQTNYSTLAAGDKKSLVYSLIVNNNYTASTIPVQVKLSEKYGKYAENKTVNLQLNQTLASNKIVVDEKAQSRTTIQIASLASVVDKNIPETGVRNAHTFAVIIANEHYDHVADVPMALNDGNVLKSYCIKTLGLPEQNIRYYTDATYGVLRNAVQDLKNIAAAYQGDIKVLFYYAGHGIPDEATKDAYLLPVDADGTQTDVCYSVSQLYKELGEMQTAETVVFLDACFSGAQRGDGMLASARGISIKVKSGTPTGNTVVFSAAQGDQTAFPYKEEGHGMFTYYLLKKLQETKGACTLKELGDYITQQVSRQSVTINRKPQTPVVSPSVNVSDSWQTWQLR